MEEALCPKHSREGVAKRVVKWKEVCDWMGKNSMLFIAFIYQKTVVYFLTDIYKYL